jgi:hypothetical protein
MKRNWKSKISIYAHVEKSDFSDTTIDQFFQNYSLHDSYLLSFQVNGIDEVILVFQIDPSWSEDFGKFRESDVSKWPIVVLNFLGVDSFQSNLKNHSMQVGFSGVDIRPEGEKREVSIHGTYGDEYRILASNKMCYACIDSKYEKIALNKLMKS